MSPNAVDSRKLNLVISGCGTGKTFWFANHCTEVYPFRPYEILFITSRALAVDQQAAQYDTLVRLQPDDDIAGYWRDGTPPTDPDHVRITTYDKLETLLYGNDNHSLDTRALNNVKVIIFDEIHSVFTDTFIEFMKVLQLWMSNEIPQGEKLFFGLTATPGILFECAELCGIELNYIGKPTYKYKAKNLFCLDADQMVEMVNSTPAKTIIMCRYARTCYWLQKRIRGSVVLSSKNGDDYISCTMTDVRRAIVENCKLPDNVKVLIATETIREGFTFTEESGIQNVVSFFPDEMNIHQFVGRCRYDVDNLIVVGVKSKSAPVGYIGEQRKLFESFCMSPTDHPEWFDSIKDVLYCDIDDVKVGITNFKGGYCKARKPQEDNPSIQKFRKKGSAEELKKYISGHWLSKEGKDPVLIYGDDMKAQIINEVSDLHVFTKEAKIDSWRKLENVIADLGFAIENNRMRVDGKRIRYKTIVQKEG